LALPLDVLAKLDEETIHLIVLRTRGLFLIELSRRKAEEEAETVARVQMTMTAMVKASREDVEQEEAALHLHVTVEAMSLNRHQKILIDMCPDRAMDAIRADEMKDGTVADVLEREENVVAGVTVVEEGETGLKGVKMVLEWLTGDQGKHRRNWMLRWRTTGVTRIRLGEMPRLQQETITRTPLHPPRPLWQMMILI
jgi:hypothetical protein